MNQGAKNTGGSSNGKNINDHLSNNMVKNSEGKRISITHQLVTYQYRSSSLDRYIEINQPKKRLIKRSMLAINVDFSVILTCVSTYNFGPRMVILDLIVIIFNVIIY